MDNNGDDLLSFKEFPPVHGQTSAPRAQISINSPTRSTFGNKDPLDELIDDMSRSVQTMNNDNYSNSGIPPLPIDDDDPTLSGQTRIPKPSPITIEFYQKYFNVDTAMVIERIVNSIVPRKAPPDYLKTYIGKNPDLYGPFWISATLIFSIAITGNIADYLQRADLNYEWKYNFHLVSYAATAIYIYACFVPISLWAIFKWTLKPNEDNLDTDSATYTPSLMSLMCVYGYSLAVFIPVSILWVIQYSILQWSLVLSAALISGLVLILVLTPAIRNSKISMFLIVGIILAHFLLAAGFMLYFFHVPNSTAKIIQPVTEKLIQPVTSVINIVQKNNNSTS
ncbi:protein YIPF1 [Condylostylus longicornis]|uniref:protein YIPF1 n=1 Tax=Condylostylus longicornis TaxID=2530218 RepID=UPI00244E2874|nr:protein YIPF1 [Condylostylus longicornis]